MNTMTETRGYGRSIGEFLCLQGSSPPSEDIDRPGLADIKQDAALRAVVGLRRLGKAVTSDAVASFDAEPRIVALSYRWARQDAVRRHLGRSGQARLSLVRERHTELRDQRQEDAITAIDADAAAEIRHLSERGIEGLTQEQTERVFAVMRRVQELRDGGASSVPPVLRKQVSRLRQETRLPLDTALL